MDEHIKTDGTIVPALPGNGEYYTLAELQGYAGGLVQLVPLRSYIMASYEGQPYILAANEEGIALGLPINLEAQFRTGIEVRGDVLVCAASHIR